MFEADTLSRQIVNFFLCSLIISLFSCNEPQEQKRIVLKAPIEKQDLEGPLNNPILFLGSSFGEFIQSLCKASRYKELIKYTSIDTKKKYTQNELTDFYSRMQFFYPLTLKSYTKEGNEYTLLYETSINATILSIRLYVKIEDDSCRLVLKNLNSRFPFGIDPSNLK